MIPEEFFDFESLSKEEILNKQLFIKDDRKVSILEIKRIFNQMN